MIGLRRHPLSDTCPEHWHSREPGCSSCASAAEAADFWAGVEARIGHPLIRAHRVMIARIIAEPQGLRGCHDVPQPGRGPRINRISTEAIKGLARVYEAATRRPAVVRVKNVSDPLNGRTAGFDAFLLEIRKKLTVTGQLASERQFLRRARDLLKPPSN